MLRIMTLAVGLAACSGADGPTAPGAVLTTLVATPTSGILPNTPPGNSLAISVTAKDQNGTTMLNAGTPSFTSSNPNVATVSANGVVTSVAVGTANITVSLTVGSVTRTATTAISVEIPGMEANVTAPQFSFDPGEVHVRAGGTVTWTMATVPHTVWFSTAGAPNSIGQLSDAAASRTFTSPGTFAYECLIHEMRGKVHVH